MNYAVNILNVFHQSTPHEIISGVYWYDEARKECETIAKVYGLPLKTVCHVMAALSPNNKWTQNIRDTWALINAWHYGKRETVKVCTYHRNKQKAFDILDGKAELTGIKVTAFAANILGCDKAVTIDGHALSIALGERLAMKQANVRLTAKVHKAVSEAYREVSRDIGIAPNQLQAIVWQTWRRKNSNAV